MSYQFPQYDTNILTLRHKVTERQLSRALVNPTNCLPGLIWFLSQPAGRITCVLCSDACTSHFNGLLNS